MPVDPFVEGALDERTYLSTRPHWFSVLRHGAAGVAMIATGIVLILFGARYLVCLKA